MEKKRKKRLRFPNGFGSVYMLTGNRRCPWVARKTVGFKENGYPEYKIIGYYSKEMEAVAALVEYNKNPYDIDASAITFKELYEKFIQKGKESISGLTDSQIKSYEYAYNKSETLYDMRFIDVKTEAMQAVINANSKLSYASRKKIKNLYNLLYGYAMEKDIVSKDYTKFIDLGENEDESDRKPFTEDQIKKLWDKVDVDFVDTILIMIYTGMRIGELILIKPGDVNLSERWLRGGIKTSAGKDRLIPLHKRIIPLIEKRMNNPYLIVNAKGEAMKYNNYYLEKWIPLIEAMKWDNKPHDCRHTCATRLDNAGANKLSIKRILGHASVDVTDKVYTHKDIEELIKAIDLLE